MRVLWLPGRQPGQSKLRCRCWSALHRSPLSERPLRSEKTLDFVDAVTMAKLNSVVVERWTSGPRAPQSSSVRNFPHPVERFLHVHGPNNESSSSPMVVSLDPRRSSVLLSSGRCRLNMSPRWRLFVHCQGFVRLCAISSFAHVNGWTSISFRRTTSYPDSLG